MLIVEIMSGIEGDCIFRESIIVSSDLQELRVFISTYTVLLGRSHVYGVTTLKRFF